MSQLHAFGSAIVRYKIPALVVIAFIAGFALRGGKGGPHTVTTPPTVEHAGHETAQVWTCAMHPQIRRPGPGKCPICGMDLIPVRQEQSPAEGSGRSIRLSPEAAKLAEVQTVPVERKRFERKVRLFGRVEYDETRVKDITSRVQGRIDTLYVDFTGAVVKAGEPLASVYSPELFAAQEELIQAVRAARELGRSPLATIRDTAPLTVEAAREKLRLLGLTPPQIADIERSDRPVDHVTVSSPLGGVVIEKDAVEGMYLETGMKLFRVADLSTVWVKLDVYESDVFGLRVGQEVEFTGDAFPGETFHGRIAFIDPVLDPMTRTVHVRVEVPNPLGRLKPDMFVRGDVKSGISEVATARPSGAAPLVVPASAVLVTGKRAVVYIAASDTTALYEGREIVLGPRAGDFYQVASGLREGELVVVNGAFKIDSAVQILAKPSMMNPEGGVTSTGHIHGAPPGAAPASAAPAGEHAGHTAGQQGGGVPAAFTRGLGGVFDSYLALVSALGRDSLPDTRSAAGTLGKALAATDMTLLSGEIHMEWMKEMGIIVSRAGEIAKAKTLENARSAFIPLSASLIRVAGRFGVPGTKPLYRIHCPMADNNKGADWLQDKKTVENPFLGSKMFTCGELKETIPAGGGTR